MDPLFVTEELTSMFKYWSDDQIHEGMTYDNELFRLTETYKTVDRKRMFDHAWALIIDGMKVVITASSYRYAVWVELRSPQASNSSHSESKDQVDGAGHRANDRVLSSQARWQSSADALTYAA